MNDGLQVLTPLQEAESLLEAHPGNPNPWLISGTSTCYCFSRPVGSSVAATVCRPAVKVDAC